jgi:Na+/H+-translocating membrane pyrophosphatase
LEFLKYDYIVCMVAGLIFFLIILAFIEHFENLDLSLIYLYGVLESAVVGLVVAIVAQLGISRIGKAAGVSLQDTDWIARLTSNFVAFFVCGLSSLIIALILIVPESEQIEMPLEEAKRISKKVLAFSFGVSTVAIGTKIISVIYGKGSEAGLALMGEELPDLARNHHNPAVICKAVGENIRKIVSNAIDYNMYFCLSMTCGISAAGINVVGADQEGEIIFSLSNCNLYLPLLAVLFTLTVILLVNLLFKFISNPSNGSEIALNFKREIYLVLILMSGFLALAAYLSLPV